MVAILVAADSTADSSQQMISWLQGDGYQVVVVDDCHQLSAAALTHQPDLVLVDIDAWQGESLRICREIREDSFTSHIPLMILTKQNPIDARVQVLLVGAAGFLSKPIRHAEFSVKIAGVLGQSGQAGSVIPSLLDDLVQTVQLSFEDCALSWLFSVDAQNHILEARAIATQGKHLEVRLSAGLERDATAYQVPLINSSSPLADAVLNRQTLFDISLSTLERYPGIQVLCSALAIVDINTINLFPLAVNNQIVGLLICGTTNPGIFNDLAARRKIAALCSQAAVVIDYTQLAATMTEQEAIMEAEHAFLVMILDAMGDGLIVIGDEGQIEFVNNRLLLMSGYKQEEISGQSVEMLFHPDDRAELMYSLLQSRGSTMKFGQRFYTKNQYVIPILMSRTSFARIDPDASQQVLVLSDLTAQKAREDELERQGQQLQALNRAAEAISSSLAPHEVLLRILIAAVDMTGAEGASVLLRDQDDPDCLVFVSTVGPSAEVVQGLRVPIDSGIAGWVVREATSQLVEDTAYDDRFYQDIDQTSGFVTRSIIAVPLIISEQVIGVLEVINKMDGNFDRVDMDLLESMAGTASVAIDNARLFEQTRRRLDDLGTLLDASAAVSSTLDVGSVLELIARRLLIALEVERCLIIDWDHLNDRVYALAEVADAYWQPGTGPVASLDDFPARRLACETGTPMFAHFRTATGDVDELTNLRASGQNAMLAIPIWLSGSVKGLVYIFNSLPDSPYTGEDAVALEKVVQQWCAAIEAEDVAGWNTLPVLDKLVEELQFLPGVMWIAIEQWDTTQHCMVRIREQGFALWSDKSGVQAKLSDRPTIQRVLTIAQPKVVRYGGLDNDPLEREFLNRIGGQVTLLAPFNIQGRPAGLIKLVDSDPKRHFDAEQISLGQGIANVVGNALENANLYQSLERRAEALEAAYGDLKQADELKDDLLQNLSHEIQTPMMHILGYLELMHGEAFGPLTAEQRERLAFVIERAQSVSDLTKNIISVQMLQAQSIEVLPTDMLAVVKDAVGSQERAASERGMTFDIVLSPALSSVVGDHQQLVEALSHLINNAIKFGPDEQVIQVAVQEREAVLLARVKDRGIGIDEQYHTQIFKRFFQVDGGASRHYGGAGLGLAIVQEIVMQHGGRVWVESVPGKGSAFYFTVPKAGKITQDDFGTRQLKTRRL